MEAKSKMKTDAKNINKPVYITFLLAGIYFMATKDFSNAAIFWGISLAFDPFNIEVPYNKRPFYQKAWLIVHVSISLAMYGLLIWG